MAMSKEHFRKRSMMTGKVHVRTIELDVADYALWRNESWPIQRAMPYLSVADREFLMTGTTPEEWNDAFNKGEVLNGYFEP